MNLHLVFNWRRRKRDDLAHVLHTIFFLIFISNVQQGTSEPNKIYQISELCEKSPSFLSTYRTIDGALILSRNEKNLHCTIKFQTNSILQRFMLRFESLNLDCNDKLHIYDGAHVGVIHRTISCQDTREKLGSLFTRTNHVTLKYVTDSWGVDNGFKLVITAIKDGKHSCKDFRCSEKEFCINPDLLCDKINHCDDGSDEEIGTVCQAPVDETILGIKSEWIVVITICTLLIFLACGFSVGICICRRRLSRNISGKAAAATTSVYSNSNQQPEVNGSKHLNFYRPAVDYLRISQRKSAEMIRPYCRTII